MVTNVKPRPRQFHLSTMLALVLTAAVIVGLNLRWELRKLDILAGQSASYGWPLAVWTDNRHAILWSQPATQIALGIDFVFNLILIVLIARFCEWWTRTARRRLQTALVVTAFSVALFGSLVMVQAARLPPSFFGQSPRQVMVNGIEPAIIDQRRVAQVIARDVVIVAVLFLSGALLCEWAVRRRKLSAQTR